MFLGVDIGSSFVKTALLDPQLFTATQLRKAPVPGFAAHPDPLIRECDPELIVIAVRDAIDSYLSADATIEGIFFSTQMHGFLLMGADGRHITNYVTWQDERSSAIIAGRERSYLDEVAHIVEPATLRRSGMPLKHSLASCNLFHWRHHNTISPRSWFCSLGDYVIARLTAAAPCAHLTNAAATGLVDLEAGDWNMELIACLGYQALSFPQILPISQPCGTIERHGRRIPLYPAVGDHQAAMYGLFLQPERDLALNMGTGSQICVVSEELTYGQYETRPYFEGAYLRAIPHLPAGRALSVLVAFFEEVGRELFDQPFEPVVVWDRINALVERVDPVDATNLTVDLSFYRTSPTIYGGAIAGITENNLRIGNLFHAAFTNMAHNYHELYPRLLREGAVIERIFCAGGLSDRHPALRRILQQTFGLPCTVPPHTEDTLVGLLRLAQRAKNSC